MIETSESVKAIAGALAKAQASMHGATKDGKNPAFKSSYATLASVIMAARGPLSENGVVFMQAPGSVNDQGFLPIETLFLHGESGEWIKFTFPIPIVKRDPQGFGSATTYGCRYSLMAALGLPPVDDDGNAASGNGAAPPRPSTKPHRLEPLPPQLEGEAEAASAYVALAKTALLNAECKEDVDSWWRAETENREKNGVRSGTSAFEEVKALAGETKRVLPYRDMRAAG